MANQPTCGRGLAEQSFIPKKVAALIASVAENLEVHIQTLDLKDERAKAERDAYLRLAAEHRRLAEELQTIGDEMASYRDLPMAKHDPKAMASPKVLESLEHFVKHERDLLASLEKSVERDQKILVEMVVASSASDRGVR